MSLCSKLKRQEPSTTNHHPSLFYRLHGFDGYLSIKLFSKLHVAAVMSGDDVFLYRPTSRQETIDLDVATINLIVSHR